VTQNTNPGGRCAVSAVVSAPSIRLKGRGRSPSGPKIHNPKFIIQNPSPQKSASFPRHPLQVTRHGGEAANPKFIIQNPTSAKVLGNFKAQKNPE
jgi:hypothetical protein